MDSLRDFLLLAITLRLWFIIALEHRLLRDVFTAFKDKLAFSVPIANIPACYDVITPSFPYFIGRLATSSYSFSPVSIILLLFSPAHAASYFFGVRVLASRLTINSFILERYALVCMTENITISSFLLEKHCKPFNFIRSLRWSFPLIVSVFVLTLYTTSTAVPLGFSFSYPLKVCIALVFSLSLISLIVGNINTAMLTRSYYLIVSAATIYCVTLCFSLSRHGALFFFYIIALCLIELLLLSVNAFGLSMNLKDSRICRALVVPTVYLAAICLTLAITQNVWFFNSDSIKTHINYACTIP